MSTTPRGSTTGLTDWFYYHQESPALETNEDRDLFGYALSAGDYNGDGLDDTATVSPGSTRPAGRYQRWPCLRSCTSKNRWPRRTTTRAKK